MPCKHQTVDCFHSLFSGISHVSRSSLGGAVNYSVPFRIAMGLSESLIYEESIGKLSNDRDKSVKFDILYV